MIALPMSSELTGLVPFLTPQESVEIDKILDEMSPEAKWYESLVGPDEVSPVSFHIGATVGMGSYSAVGGYDRWNSVWKVGFWTMVVKA